MSKRLKIVAAAFGDPRDEMVQSGVAKHLFAALESRADVAAYLSTKQLRFWDAFEGVVDFSKVFKYGRPGISTNWMWRKKTLEKLTARFEAQMNGLDSIDAVLQVGTNVCVRRNGVRHYCRTDMTISQGVKSKQFSVAALKGKRVAEAIETQREIFENCDGIFVTSNWVKESINKDYGIDQAKIHVVGVGASLSGDVNRNEKESGCNILFVGRNWQRKGGPLLVEAFKRIRNSVEKAQLTVIGCAPEVLEDGVTVLGPLNNSIPQQSRMIEDAYRNADVLCVPSEFEPFGICFAEAQFYGVVPVTFAGEGRAEAIKDGVTGVLVRERTADALSQVLMNLLDDGENVKRMSLAGQSFARENFTYETVVEKMLKVMESSRN